MILAVQPNGEVMLHKSRRNNTNSFSIGRTWNIQEIEFIEVLRPPTMLRITISSRRFIWHSEVQREQTDFLVSLVRSYRQYTHGRSPRLSGFGVQEIPNSPPAYVVPNRSSGTAAAASATPPSSSSNRPSASSSNRQPPPSTTSNKNNNTPSSSNSNVNGSSRPILNSSTQPQLPPPSTDTSDVSNTSTPMRQQMQRLPPSSSSSSSNSNSNSNPASSAYAIPPTTTSSRPTTAQSAASASSNYNNNPTANSLSTSPSAPNLIPPPIVKTPSSSSVNSTSSSSSPRSRPNVPLPPSSSSTRSTTATASAPTIPPAPDHASSASASAPTTAAATIPPSTKASEKNDKHRQQSKERPKLTVNGIENPKSSPSSSSLNLPPSPRSVHSPVKSPTIQQHSTSPSSAVEPPNEPPLSSASVHGTFFSSGEETASALDNVEEMLDGLEWRGFTSLGLTGSKKPAGIEQRLIEELRALEQASIHATAESDVQAQLVVKHLDEALAELDRMDQMLSMYKNHLNVVTDDIKHIESQSKGLQVQTTNQRSLLRELESLLDTVHIPRADLAVLSDPFESHPVADVEKAIVSLYKAILSTRDAGVGGLAAASENVSEYRKHSHAFVNKFHESLDKLIQKQISKSIKNSPSSKSIDLQPHKELEDALGKYVGIMLFVKEIEDSKYQKICATYFTNMSGLYKREINEIFNQVKASTRRPTEEEVEASMSHSVSSKVLGRSGTLKRTPTNRERKPTMINHGIQNLRKAMEIIVPHVQREQEFVADFLHLLSLERYITFADYMDLETVFKRNASNYLSTHQNRFKDVKTALELIFGFLGTEIATIVDAIIQIDPTQVVGALAALDIAISNADAAGLDVVSRMAQKQYQKYMAEFTKQAKERLQAIEQTKLTTKKRKGVAPFMRVFPQYVEMTESQLDGCSRLRIRKTVDELYSSMVKSMFDSLQQMAQMDQEESAVANEDKDQLNYHVVLIENMHHFVTTMKGRRSSESLKPFVRQARTIYDENLKLYVRFVLRRPLAKLLDFFKGLEQLLQTTPATEVGMHSEYKRSAFKRALGSLDTKDLKRSIEQLGKRVDKHFNDVSNPSAENRIVITTVWRACQGEFVSLTNKWSDMAHRCYPDLKLEYKVEDIDHYFTRFSPVPGGASSSLAAPE